MYVFLFYFFYLSLFKVLNQANHPKQNDEYDGEGWVDHSHEGLAEFDFLFILILVSLLIVERHCVLLILLIL